MEPEEIQRFAHGVESVHPGQKPVGDVAVFARRAVRAAGCFVGGHGAVPEVYAVSDEFPEREVSGFEGFLE